MGSLRISVAIGLTNRLARCRSAAIAPLTALLLIPIAGAIAYGVEAGGMQYVHRSAQNAADAAAIGAAINNSTTGTTFLMEARAAARPFGFVDGQNGVTVTSSKLLTCPTGTPAGSTCYDAVISTSYPLSFSRLIGFLGSGGSGSQNIVARAVAKSGPGGGGGSSTPVCLWSLSLLETLTFNGSPAASLTGCALVSNGNMNCNGHTLGADYAIQGQTESKDSGCAALSPQNNLGPNDPNWPGLPSDPYKGSSFYGNIPSDTCGGVYHPDPNIKKDGPNKLDATFTGEKKFCGDVQLTNNIVLSGSDTTLVVYNGKLDLNGKSISTASGASATIILAGTSTLDASKGTIDIKAPPSTSTSAWKGVAIYQDPRSTAAAQTSSLSGSQSTFNVTGLVYLPKTNLVINGVVNKATGGSNCLLIIANTMTFNGIDLVARTTECPSAGLGSAPTVAVGGGTVVKLVL